MIFRKIFEPVVDDNRPSDNFGMRKLFTGNKNLHEGVPCGLVLKSLRIFLFILADRISHSVVVYYIINLIMRNPPRRRIKKRMASRLKYLSIRVFISGPNFRNKAATAKKRRERLSVEAMRKSKKLSLKTPEAMVKILYGMGVNPARKTYQKPLF